MAFRMVLMPSMVRGLFKKVVRRLLSRVTQSQVAAAGKRYKEWAIGIYTGNSPCVFVSPKNVNNPVLTCKDVSDARALAVADPFMVRVNDTWYMFFEVLSRHSNRNK